MSGDFPFVSVVVPVRGEAPGLDACVGALALQTWPADRREVIVVDNGASVAHRPGVRVVREEGEGSYAARNRGIAEARGEVIAFTDADCVPAPDWIERGVGVLRSEPAAGLVAGRIRITFLDPARPTAVERYEAASSFRQEHYVRRRRFGATANVFTTRAVLGKVGAFDARLNSLGDVDWGVRVHEAGFRLVYAEDARVDHPARRTLGEFLARSARMTGGFRDLGRTGRWPLGKRLRYGATGLPPLSAASFHPAVLGVGAAVVGVRVITLARLLLGGRSRR
jgi:glycosyltransferase involved in cell wall biosynthesis